MPTLYALLVGINEYPSPVRPLSGCINDVSDVRLFFEKYAEDQSLGYEVHVLTNEQATRRAIIDGFAHFHPAGDQDLCVFYYSGHGASSEAPDVFWNNASNLNESLVCYDSRQPGGRDLMDKELAYLIWKATKDSGVHFLAIMDCCHAGSATRMQPKETERWETPQLSPPRLQDYLGYDEYLDRGNGQLSPPDGKHILLAASRNKETAKEKLLRRKYHGVFTFSLLKELEQGGIYSTYSELMQRCNLRVRALTYQQSPQLEPCMLDPRMGFLGNEPKRGAPHQVYFDTKEDSWLLNAGSIQGIVPPRAGFDTLLELEDGTELKVTQAASNWSRVNGMGDRSIKLVWPAWLTSSPVLPLPVKLAPGIPLLWKTMIADQIAHIPELTVAGEEEEAQYIVDNYNGHLVLIRQGEEYPVFKRMVMELPEETVSRFLEMVTHVAAWERVLRMENPTTGLDLEDVRVDFTVLKDSNTVTADQNRRSYTNPDEAVELTYYSEHGRWREPAYQFRLSNTTRNKVLWVSVLLLNSDFSIENEYLRKQELEPGQEIWLDTQNGQPDSNVFEAYIDDTYLNNGCGEITDYIKVIVSTNELDTDCLTQPPLELDGAEEKRGSPRGSRPAHRSVSADDWMTKIIPVRIIRPPTAG